MFSPARMSQHVHLQITFLASRSSQDECWTMKGQSEGQPGSSQRPQPKHRSASPGGLCRPTVVRQWSQGPFPHAS